MQQFENHSSSYLHDNEKKKKEQGSKENILL